MANERKVVIADTPEDIKNLGFDEAVTLATTDDPDVMDVRAQEAIEEYDLQIEAEESKDIEDLADDVEIWDGGPNAGMIKEWKQYYGDVYVTSISYDKHIVWRVLNRNEYKQIVKKMEQLVQGGQLTSAEANMWNEEAITELCVLYPKYDKKTALGVMAGMPSLIAQEVLEASGFVALEVRQL
jgi:hypothetical protein